MASKRNFGSGEMIGKKRIIEMYFGLPLLIIFNQMLFTHRTRLRTSKAREDSV